MARLAVLRFSFDASSTRLKYIASDWPLPLIVTPLCAMSPARPMSQKCDSPTGTAWLR